MKDLIDMTEPELKAYFNGLMKSIENQLPPGPSAAGKMLFTLMVFDQSGIAQYASNANRSDMVKALRQTADRIERRQDVRR